MNKINLKDELEMMNKEDLINELLEVYYWIDFTREEAEKQLKEDRESKEMYEDNDLRIMVNYFSGRIDSFNMTLNNLKILDDLYFDYHISEEVLS